MYSSPQFIHRTVAEPILSSYEPFPTSYVPYRQSQLSTLSSYCYDDDINASSRLFSAYTTNKQNDSYYENNQFVNAGHNNSFSGGAIKKFATLFNQKGRVHDRKFSGIYHKYSFDDSSALFETNNNIDDLEYEVSKPPKRDDQNTREHIYYDIRNDNTLESDKIMELNTHINSSIREEVYGVV